MANLPHRLGLHSSPTPCYPAADFNDCMNTVHQRVQFTWEEKERCVMTTKIYRKPSYTNIGLKPQSCQDPKTATASFKGELCLCYRLCSSLELTKNEVEFTLNLFEDNGHNREKQTHQQLQTIDHQRQGQQNKNKNKDTTNHYRNQRQSFIQYRPICGYWSNRKLWTLFIICMSSSDSLFPYCIISLLMMWKYTSIILATKTSF